MKNLCFSKTFRGYYSAILIPFFYYPGCYWRSFLLFHQGSCSPEKSEYRSKDRSPCKDGSRLHIWGPHRHILEKLPQQMWVSPNQRPHQISVPFLIQKPPKNTGHPVVPGGLIPHDSRHLVKSAALGWMCIEVVGIGL